MLGGEPLPAKGLAGNFFSALSPDGKSLYVSGLFANDGAKASPPPASGATGKSGKWTWPLGKRKSSLPWTRRT